MRVSWPVMKPVSVTLERTNCVARSMTSPYVPRSGSWPAARKASPASAVTPTCGWSLAVTS
jgi:hypothetical protein